MGKTIDHSEIPKKEEVQRKFGKRLAELRDQTKFTQETFAEALDVDRTYVSYLERGKRNPSLYMLWKIAKALKVDFPELFKF